mgnify:CR=1 FL=1
MMKNTRWSRAYSRSSPAKSRLRHGRQNRRHALARVTLTEEDERVQVTTELGVDGKSAAHSYDYPLSGTEYEKEGQRRHAVGISFFGAAKDLLGISPAWGA